MKIVEANMIDSLDGKVQYQIPIYQRKYSWEKKNCEKFLDDIIKVSHDKNRKSHYMGSIIYLAVDEECNYTALKKNQIIDGQQRLTSLSLLLIALGDYAKDTMSPDEYLNSELSFEALKESYLVNKRFGDEDYYKLMLTEEDFNVYKSILNQRCLPKDISESKLWDNYCAFREHMNKLKVPAKDIFIGINKLKIGDISLIKDDNAQLVFETVNSTGLNLSTPDKIRNFILMNATEPEQTKLYKELWHPMELSFGLDKKGIKEFEDFFYYYVAVLTEEKGTSEYYDSFKAIYMGASSEEIKLAVEQIVRYSKHYKRWLSTAETSVGIDKLLYNIRCTGQWRVTPTILCIIDNLEKNVLSENDSKNMLRYIESYIIRRQLCNLPANTIGEAYLNMQKNVYSLKGFINCIYDLTEKQRMPSDQEMHNTLRTAPLYGSYNGTRKVLDRIENYMNKDYSHNDSHSIEHIMPQCVLSHEDLYARTDISENKKEELDWASDLGEQWKSIHDKYCNTIGNLTLTGYNSEYQNYRFKIKQNMENETNGIKYGYKYSCIHMTSSTLSSIEKWSEDEIINRANYMIDKITEIWPFPSKTKE